MTVDTVIVGAGLAGASAALYLCRSERVLVLEAAHPAAGASGAAAGLANPFMGRRARPVWRMTEAMDALREALALAEASPLFRPGILRPAFDTRQADAFEAVAAAHPRRTRWLPPGEAVHPAVRAPHGALFLTDGGALSPPDFVAAMLAAATDRGAEVRTGVTATDWEEHREYVRLTARDAGRPVHVEARRLVLAPGAGYRFHPELARLNLHPVKGQTVRVKHPPALTGLPPLAGSGYVVPEGDTLVVGSSYEHRFSDPHPSPAQTPVILDAAARMLPFLTSASPVGATAGVRVNVPGTRLPMLGPLPGRSRVWVFTGLGSKGLLMAPLLARDLPAYFRHPASIPEAIRVHRG